MAILGAGLNLTGQTSGTCLPLPKDLGVAPLQRHTGQQEDKETKCKEGTETFKTVDNPKWTPKKWCSIWLEKILLSFKDHNKVNRFSLLLCDYTRDATRRNFTIKYNILIQYVHERYMETYVYMERLESYVDVTPYFTSLKRNISLASQPLDWRQKKKKKKTVRLIVWKIMLN